MVRALTVFVALAVLWGTEAHASQCAPPFPFVLPRTSVPEGGELYVFMPVSDRDGIHREQVAAFQRNTLGELWVESASGKPLPFELRRVHLGDVFDVFSVTALLSDGREVTAAPIVLEPPPSYESVPIRFFH